MIVFLIDNICIKIGNHLFWQCIGIYVGILVYILVYIYVLVRTVPDSWLICFCIHMKLNL